jgi:hypothetical protein
MWPRGNGADGRQQPNPTLSQMLKLHPPTCRALSGLGNSTVQSHSPCHNFEGAICQRFTKPYRDGHRAFVADFAEKVTPKSVGKEPVQPRVYICVGRFLVRKLITASPQAAPSHKRGDPSNPVSQPPYGLRKGYIPTSVSLQPSGKSFHRAGRARRTKSRPSAYILTRRKSPRGRGGPWNADGRLSAVLMLGWRSS